MRPFQITEEHRKFMDKIRAAWGKFSKHQQDHILPALKRVHQMAMDIQAGKKNPMYDPTTIGSHMALVYSAITNDEGHLIANLQTGVKVWVGPRA